MNLCRPLLQAYHRPLISMHPLVTTMPIQKIESVVSAPKAYRVSIVGSVARVKQRVKEFMQQNPFYARPSLLPQKEGWIKALVSNTTSEGDVYIQHAEGRSFADFCRQILATNPQPIGDADIRPNQMVLCETMSFLEYSRFPIERICPPGSLLRARVLECKNELVTVDFVDVGEVGVLSCELDNMFKMPEQFAGVPAWACYIGDTDSDCTVVSPVAKPAKKHLSAHALFVENLKRTTEVEVKLLKEQPPVDRCESYTTFNTAHVSLRFCSTNVSKSGVKQPVVFEFHPYSFLTSDS